MIERSYRRDGQVRYNTGVWKLLTFGESATNAGGRNSMTPRELQLSPSGIRDIFTVFVGARFLHTFSLDFVKVQHHIGVPA